MKNKTLIIVTLFFILSLAYSAFAQESQPREPIIQKNKCPFEGCMYGKWITKSPLTVYRTEGGTSVAFSIRPGTSFTAVAGNAHIEKAGIAIVQKDTTGFKKGDKVYLLSYRGEGTYDIWYKGKISNSDESNVLLKIIQTSKMSWWVKVKLNDGRQGWLKLKNLAKEGGFKIKENIDGTDRFG